MQGLANPFFGAAAGFGAQSAMPISGNQVANYFNPYANSVLGNLNEVFGQQARNTTGQLQQAAGGVGANRIALGQGELARQQGLAAGQTMSGVYQNALQAAQQDAQRQQGASYLFANMGPAAQNAALQGNQALLQSGQTQQAQGQNELNSLYGQQQAQFAYPFQTPQYLAGITGGLAPAMGGTTTGQSQTTYPAPSALSQIAGGLTGALGLMGGMGGIPGMGGGKGTKGGGAGMVPSFRFGGHVRRRAMGGDSGEGTPFRTNRVGTNPFKGSLVPDTDLNIGQVHYPTIDLRHAKMPEDAGGGDPGKMGSQLGGAFKKFGSSKGSNSNGYNWDADPTGNMGSLEEGAYAYGPGGAVGPYSMFQSFEDGGDVRPPGYATPYDREAYLRAIGEAATADDSVGIADAPLDNPLNIRGKISQFGKTGRERISPGGQVSGMAFGGVPRRAIGGQSPPAQDWRSYFQNQMPTTGGDQPTGMQGMGGGGMDWMNKIMQSLQQNAQTQQSPLPQQGSPYGAGVPLQMPTQNQATPSSIQPTPAPQQGEPPDIMKIRQLADYYNDPSMLSYATDPYSKNGIQAPPARQAMLDELMKGLPANYGQPSLTGAGYGFASTAGRQDYNNVGAKRGGGIPRRADGGFNDRWDAMSEDIPFSDRFDPTYEGFGYSPKNSEKIPEAMPLSDLPKMEADAVKGALREAPVLDEASLGLGQKPNWDAGQDVAPDKVRTGAKPADFEDTFALPDAKPTATTRVTVPAKYAEGPRTRPDVVSDEPPPRVRSTIDTDYPGVRRMKREDMPYPDSLKRNLGEQMARSPWLALARAGFAAMGGTSPYAGVNIGRGAVEGLKHLDDQRGALMKEEEINLRAQGLWQQAQQHADQYKYQTANQKAALEMQGQYKFTPTPMGLMSEHTKSGKIDKIPWEQVQGLNGEMGTKPGEPPAGAQPGVPPQIQPPPPGAGAAPSPQGAVPTAPPAPPVTAQPPPQAGPLPPQQRPPLGSDAPPLPSRIPISPSDMIPGAAQAQRQVTVAAQKKAQEAAIAGQNTATMLEQTEHALAQLPKEGFLAPGSGQQARAQVAKNLNSVADMLGIPDAKIDPNAVGSTEELKKLTTRMGFELSRTLGAREAMQIVQQATAAVPGSDNTPLGARKIIAGVRAAIDQQIAWKNFLDQWVNKSGGNSNGAQEYFNRMRPPAYWNAKSWAELVDPADGKALVENRSNPAAIAAINRKYGPGVAEFMLQRQFGRQ